MIIRTKLVVIIVALMGISFLSAISWAGEKEELSLKQLALQERIGRLQAEFELARRDLVTVQDALKALAEKEKAEQEKGKK